MLRCFAVVVGGGSDASGRACVGVGDVSATPLMLLLWRQLQ